MTTLGAIWLLFGGKSGDNAQVQALGDRLAARDGWHYKVKQLKHQRGELLLHALSRPSLRGLTAACRGQLAPPWPDLVITAGRRNELPALWIKARSPETRVVHVGRPWCRPSRFDLVITTPQYQLEAAANVLEVGLPLNAVDPARIEAARARWRERFEALPAPRTVLLLGGNSGAYVFGRGEAESVAAAVGALLDRSGGSLLVTTSARTPAGFTTALLEQLPAPAFLHRYGDAGDNPYFGLLAWGDQFVVTEDSVSMVAEARATGRPVQLARISSMDSAPGWWLKPANLAWKPLTHRLAQRFAPRRFHRNVRRLHESLMKDGGLSWLGAATPAPAAPGLASGEKDLERSAARVAALLEP